MRRAALGPRKLLLRADDENELGDGLASLLPLTEELVRRLNAWNHHWQSGGSREQPDAWLSEGAELARLLQLQGGASGRKRAGDLLARQVSQSAVRKPQSPSG